MRTFSLTLLACLAAGTLGFAQKPGNRPGPPPMPKIEGFTDEKTQGSYALGQYVAGYLKSNSISEESINLNVLLESFTSAIKGEESKMSEQDSMQTVQAFLNSIRTRAAEASKAAGKAYMAENGKKKEVTTLANGIQYEVLTEGKGAIPKVGDKTSVHYIGTLIDGTEFDQSRSKGRPFPVTVGRGVIKGWSEILKIMPAGSRWKVTIPPELAYGERGSGKIAPGATLIFDMELLTVTPAPPKGKVEAVTPPVAIPPRKAPPKRTPPKPKN